MEKYVILGYWHYEGWIVDCWGENLDVMQAVYEAKKKFEHVYNEIMLVTWVAGGEHYASLHEDNHYTDDMLVTALDEKMIQARLERVSQGWSLKHIL